MEWSVLSSVIYFYLLKQMNNLHYVVVLQIVLRHFFVGR